MRRALLSTAATASSLLLATTASAAPPWVDRHLTLPAGDWAFDFGLGLAHAPPPVDDTSVGMNAEVAVGLTNRIELGVRTGLRFGDAFERGLHPDEYGRLFDRQYVDGGNDPVANPEVRLRGALVAGPVVDLGLEGRLFVPVEDNRQAAVEFGLPLAFHLGESVRLDTGVWVPVLFDYATPFGLIVPFDVWIQVTPRVWLGPMSGIDIVRVGNQATVTDVSMGFAVGYQVARFVDLKTMFLFPALNQDSRAFGLGAGVQIRIE
ncbi:MAG TPA: hypothetical protein VIF09_05190 [Polyangiaceae bacterium]|jgi:hypothetical protein